MLTSPITCFLLMLANSAVAGFNLSHGHPVYGGIAVALAAYNFMKLTVAAAKGELGQ